MGIIPGVGGTNAAGSGPRLGVVAVVLAGSVALFRELRGRTSGFAIPQYVLDTPYGKVPLAHPHLRGREGDDIVVETYDGRLWREPNPR